MRTYRTVSLSLHPLVVKQLDEIGKATGRTGARVAAEIVMAAIGKTSLSDRLTALEDELAAIKAQLSASPPP